MIEFEEIGLTPETQLDVDAYRKEVEAFREEGPLDRVSLAKLEEHFRALHVYNSAGIEGNRLTLQETLLVLRDGMDISGKPLRDSIEARNLGQAFDYLRELSDENIPIRETDVRHLHELVVGDSPELSPGEYRKVGVIISGSEHRPPEPLEVPSRMGELVRWINSNSGKNPVVLASLAHHELAAIHPFKDGNGRVSRLLMNLLLMRTGFPISNLSRDNRPAYYDALSFADVGIFDPLVRQVKNSSGELFAELTRIRAETKRTELWAEKWGIREREALQKREQREHELWLSRTKQVFLEYQNASELLNDRIDQLEIDFYDYKTEIDFEKYQRLLEKGFIERANAFSITFRPSPRQIGREERFMFRYYRSFQTFPGVKFIPLELNYLDKSHPGEAGYVRIAESTLREIVRLRAIYFHDDGALGVRALNRDTNREIDLNKKNISDTVQMFFDDVLEHLFHISR
ncbi:MAG TPA: Fic family protein [Terracidiphilus sp.]|jgi:Fic family protein